MNGAGIPTIRAGGGRVPIFHFGVSEGGWLNTRRATWMEYKANVKESWPAAVNWTAEEWAKRNPTKAESPATFRAGARITRINGLAVIYGVDGEIVFTGEATIRWD